MIQVTLCLLVVMQMQPTIGVNIKERFERSHINRAEKLCTSCKHLMKERRRRCARGGSGGGLCSTIISGSGVSTLDARDDIAFNRFCFFSREIPSRRYDDYNSDVDGNELPTVAAVPSAAHRGGMEALDSTYVGTVDSTLDK